MIRPIQHYFEYLSLSLVIVKPSSMAYWSVLQIAPLWSFYKWGLGFFFLFQF